MIKVLIGDLFESKTTTIVNTVNCAGVMGKGIALEFKKRFPEMFKDYVKRCKSGQVQLGKPYYYSDPSGVSIINFPTKEHWRSPAKLNDIIEGLDEFLKKHQEWGVKSVAFPPLGCGNGGLDWSIVGPIMYQKLSNLDIPIEIYAPYGIAKQYISIDFLQKESQHSNSLSGRQFKKMRPSWIILLEIIHNLEKQPHINPIGRTIFQKICYIVTELGIDTGLNFKQGSYGPFSDGIKEILSVFANANLIQEKQLGKMTAIKIGPEYSTIREKFLSEINQFQTKIDKTVDLFSRISSTTQAEEVATVLYSARELKRINTSPSENDLLEYIINWKKNWDTNVKRQTIASTIRNLVILKWLSVEYSELLSSQIDEY